MSGQCVRGRVREASVMGSEKGPQGGSGKGPRRVREGVREVLQTAPKWYGVRDVPLRIPMVVNHKTMARRAATQIDRSRSLYIHVYTICIYACTYTYTYTCMCIPTLAHTPCVDMRICTYIYTATYIHTDMYIYRCTKTCIDTDTPTSITLIVIIN